MILNNLNSSYDDRQIKRQKTANADTLDTMLKFEFDFEDEINIKALDTTIWKTGAQDWLFII